MPVFEAQLKVILESVNPTEQFGEWLKSLDAKDVEDIALLAASESDFEALYEAMIAGGVPVQKENLGNRIKVK